MLEMSAGWGTLTFNGQGWGKKITKINPKMQTNNLSNVTNVKHDRGYSFVATCDNQAWLLLKSNAGEKSSNPQPLPLPPFYNFILLIPVDYIARPDNWHLCCDGLRAIRACDLGKKWFLTTWMTWWEVLHVMITSWGWPVLVNCFWPPSSFQASIWEM